ncbi:MAG: plasmid pRiA4b ORF-3 family protein [Planctomycetaceae bacterium]|jgi:hypothetical protein|nr:plasmid pRiA4b ORF-3 family protein [Planctomycetaceae bacterium]
MPKKTIEQILCSLEKVFQKNAVQTQPSKVSTSKPTECRFLQLKVSLKNIQPSIWRRIVVPDDLTLEDLHDVLQVVMGWENAHLYEFIIGSNQTGRHFSRPITNMGGSFGGFGFDDFGQEDVADFDLTFFTRKGMKFRYIYDFGDSWDHEIVVENPDYNHSGESPVFVLAGKRNCPPEDCGGVGGYYDIIEALKNTETGEDENELLDWLGDYDPEEFDIEQCNVVLAGMFGTSPPKKPKKSTKKATKKKTKKRWSFLS